MRRSGLYLLATLLSAACIATVAVLGAAAASADTGTGSFSAPFGEPGPNCPQDSPAFPMLPSPPSSTPCKVAAVSMAFLPTGNVLYWNGLEGMENIQFNTVAEDGQTAVCDRAKLLTLNYSNLPGSQWNTAGDGLCSTTLSNYPSDYLIPGLPIDGQGMAPDALFCSSLVFLANGDVLTTGGTDYYDEPNVPGTPYGVSELEGTKTTRVYDPKLGWLKLADMNYGRWYPSLVTLPSGDLFVASGVTKLLKPVYPNSITDSGTNVEETETFHISGPQAGQWTFNGTQANFTLPLFPRLHLLPDGKVWYDAGGQVFNPDGQSYDEVLWNFPAIYDPSTKTWTREMTIPGVGTLTPGFRGSGFSVQLPLKPPYTTASFLSGGGVDGVSPGTYLATNTSEINTIDTSKGDAWTNSPTNGNLNNARWYSTAVVLPDESVMAFSGATADEVVAPGTGMPVKQAERYDPTTGTWTAMATANDGRTYHNTAMLLPTGQVLVGGHSPINFLYSREETLPGGFSNNYRDYTFEIYNPPYMSEQRPVISDESSQVLNYGTQFSVTTHQAAQITKVLLVRNPAITHLVDADQRTVELNFTRDGDDLHVQMPSNPAVLPPGPYYLFIDEGSGSNLIPSTAVQLFVQKNTDNQIAAAQPAAAPSAPSVPAATLAAAAKSTANARSVRVALSASERPALPLPLPLLPAAGALLAGGAVLAARRARRSRRT